MSRRRVDVELGELASKLKALGHISRLQILSSLTEGEKYLSSRALAKVHLIKLREAGLVETRVVTLEDEARALRYYKLKEFHIEISPEELRKRRETDGL
jgi:DNA-binding transcriptional ArsR family regulator